MRLHPIQKDHESCCPNCGCVLANVQDNNDVIEKPVIAYSADIFLLGSALNNKTKNQFRNPQQYYEEKVLKQLTGITKFYQLPESLAIDAFREMKRKNRGFRSETEPIKQLIKIMERDDNYGFIKKLRLIKARYENSSNC